MEKEKAECCYSFYSFHLYCWTRNTGRKIIKHFSWLTWQEWAAFRNWDSVDNFHKPCRQLVCSVCINLFTRQRILCNELLWKNWQNPWSQLELAAKEWGQYKQFTCLNHLFQMKVHWKWDWAARAGNNKYRKSTNLVLVLELSSEAVKGK